MTAQNFQLNVVNDWKSHIRHLKGYGQTGCFNPIYWVHHSPILSRKANKHMSLQANMQFSHFLLESNILQAIRSVWNYAFLLASAQRCMFSTFHFLLLLPASFGLFIGSFLDLLGWIQPSSSNGCEHFRVGIFTQWSGRLGVLSILLIL